MKLSRLVISNFRSCKAVEIEVSAMHAIVGANNAGKSNILRALDFLFNASTRTLNEESFWNRSSSKEIRVEGVFSDLTDKEKEQLSPYLSSDGTFHMARIASFEGAGVDDAVEENGDQIRVSQQYCKPLPKYDWLRESSITAKRITEWLKEPAKLVVNGHSFVDTLGTNKPSVDHWKERARSFTDERLKTTDFEDAWEDNPKGYAGVLKGTLPFFVHVPAVRDLSEEAKVLKTNPFGRLLTAVINAVATEKRNALEATLQEVTNQLNRSGGTNRFPELGKIENRLNGEIARIFSDCDLEIEFPTPSFEAVISAPRLFADDGFRGRVEFKGHGLQRAVIFSILRNYADLVTYKDNSKDRTLILAFEEPELYMHPLGQRAIRRLFKEITERGDQVLYTTHSALLVEVSDFDEVIRVETEIMELPSNKKAVCSKTRQLPAKALIDDEIARHPNLAGKVTATSIRDYYSNAYNRSRNEGFFGKVVLLVEGATEEYSLPIYAGALDLNLDLLGISIVECGGKCAMDRLFRIFNELGIPTYMLFDYDKSNSDPEIVEKSKELLELAKETSEAPVNFIAKSRVACFSETWEKDIVATTPEYAEAHVKARAALGPTAGKPMIARFIARDLASRNPPIVPAQIKTLFTQVISASAGPTCLEQLVTSE